MAWEEIQGFASPSAFERFSIWISGEVSADRAIELPVKAAYDTGTIRGGRWFCNAFTGETFRLVPPDFPFPGVWEPIPLAERFLGVAAQELEDSARDDAALRAALVHYLASGVVMNFSQGELVDLLGVSGSSVMDRAGFSEEEQERVMNKLLPMLTDEEIEEAVRSFK